MSERSVTPRPEVYDGTLTKRDLEYEPLPRRQVKRIYNQDDPDINPYMLTPPKLSAEWFKQYFGIPEWYAPSKEEQDAMLRMTGHTGLCGADGKRTSGDNRDWLRRIHDETSAG